VLKKKGKKRNRRHRGTENAEGRGDERETDEYQTEENRGEERQEHAQAANGIRQTAG
jgi:hypothetical protein